MSQTTEIWLPYPPSVNAAFRNVSGGGRKRTDGYRKWRKHAAEEIMVQRPAKFKGHYILRIKARRPDNRKRDIDNLIKPISDALVAAGVVKDDDLCVCVTAYWSERSTKNGVIIRLRAVSKGTL